MSLNVAWVNVDVFGGRLRVATESPGRSIGCD